MSFLARGSYVSTIKLSYTYTIGNIPQNTQTNTRPVPNQAYYPQKTTKRVFYTQPTTRQTRPRITTTSSPRHSVYIDNKLGTVDQSFVCGVRRNQQSSVSFVIGGETGKYFIVAVN